MKVSAGLLLFRNHHDCLQVMLAHPGGPIWKNRDLGAWSIIKGEVEPDEDLVAGALREFGEETGASLEFSELRPLGSVTQRGGKVVHAWAVEAEFTPQDLKSNTVEIPWPPRSGTTMEVPEIDRVEWFEVSVARTKINQAQTVFLNRLLEDKPFGDLH